MKKLFTLAAVSALTLSVCAQEREDVDVDADIEEITVSAPTAHPRKSAHWPAFLAVSELPETPDLVGLRLTIPYSTKQENVAGFDLGFWGQSVYFEGFQFNILRNDVKDQLSGVQVGLYNSADQADLFGVQVGAWNETGTLRGVQVGLVNLTGQMQGVQVGLINRAEELYGFQIGVVNIIRDAEMPFFPLVNIGF